MPRLEITEPITLDDGEYMAVEMSAGQIKLRSTATGKYTTMHMAELSQRVVGLPPTEFKDARAIDCLNERQLSKTLTLADHLREIVTGQHPHLKRGRAEYDILTTTQEQRVQSKLKELEATELAMVRSTLMSKLSAYKKGGQGALLDGRSTQGKAFVGPDRVKVITALCDVIVAQRGESTGTAGRLIALTKKELLLQYGSEAPEMPSDRTMYRLIENYTRGKHTLGSAKTRRSKANRPDTPFKKHEVMLPGEEIQLDSTPIDLMARVPGGASVRLHLTIAIDVKTRSILAYHFRLDAAKAVDHVGLLLQMVTPAQNQPDRQPFREMVQLQNPGVTLLSQDELDRLSARLPYVHPRTFVIDNGADFKSHPVMAAAEMFGMNVRFSPPRTPTTKSIVERMFETVNDLFFQHLPGYIANSPEFRGENVEGVLDIFAVQELFHDWVMNVWQNRPHGGLPDPLHPRMKFSPNQMADAAAAMFGSIEMPLTPDTYIRLLPQTTRVLTSTGLRYANHMYDSPELHHWRKNRTTLVVRFDPYNPSMLWAETPDGDLVECPIKDWSARKNPFYADLLPTDESEAAADERLRLRAGIALIGSTLAGTPLHRPTPDPITSLAPTGDDFDDDELIIDVPEFDPESDY